MTFQAPIGSDYERNTGIIWPGRWVDATGYLTPYVYGYHTGADLNLNYPAFDSDRHSDVYSMGDGTVTYAQLYSTRKWGNIIIIDHGIVDGKPLFSRYGHVEDIQVAVGQSVTSSDKIAKVGNGEGLFPYHLHFDISQTDILKTVPSHWPGSNRVLVLQHYVDPKAWLQAHVAGVVLPDAQIWYVIARLGLRVRSRHSTSGTRVGVLTYGTSVMLDDAPRFDQDTYTWGRIRGGIYNGNWIAMGKSDQSQAFVSTNPPT